MNLNYIQEKLNGMFKGDSRQLVIWYDDHAEFDDLIDELVLNNANIYRLKEDNWLYTKYFFEIEDIYTNYLIYAPFPRPNDKDNHLADIAYYASSFHADRISIIAQELNIQEEYKPILIKYSKFWDSQSRIDRFKNLLIGEYSEETISIGILCVLADVRAVNFDELLKKVLTCDNLDENEYLIKFDKMNILDYFWDISKEKYGYHESNPSIQKFLISLLITYTSTRFHGKIPKAWDNLLLTNKNDIEVFINNLMNNVNYSNKYEKLATEIAKKIKLETHLKRIPVENYCDCDTFEIFDLNIIDYIVDLIGNNKEELSFLQELLENRQKTHFYDKYADYYIALKWANRLIKYINKFSKEDFPKTVEEIITIYSEQWFYIDRSYMEFYYAYDKTHEKYTLQKLLPLIENMYTNTYLSKLAMYWSDKLEEYDSIDDLPAYKQYNFFKDNVQRSLRKHKTAVIISDSLRYACADELTDELNSNPTRLAEIEHMISTVPSNTALGMASLLPNKEIQFNDRYKIFVDGKPSSNIKERQKILENYIPDALAIDYSEIMSLNMAELRERLKNKSLIYIYHNQIDARGDNSATENEVFTAAKEAIDEIIRLITKLTNEAGFKNYWITADHGFIYKRDKLTESDKVDLSNERIDVKNKRYLLSKEGIELPGTSNYKLDYLGSNDIYVAVPRGMDIFKIQGAGQNYVHGGASLQEIVLPVINVKTKTASKNQDYVELSLVSLSKKITNQSTLLTFIQKENISNKILPLEAKLSFIDQSGEKISNEVIIHANKSVNSAKDREFKEKFTLRNKKYSKSVEYYLIIENLENDVEIGRYEFIIDIAISDDFMF